MDLQRGLAVLESDDPGSYVDPHRFLDEECSVIAPPRLRGYSCYAVDDATGAASTAVNFSIAVSPSVSVSPSSGPSGTTFVQPGYGFTPNSTAELWFRAPDGTTYLPAYEPTDSAGQFSHDYTSSAANQSGQYEDWAVDGPTGLQSPSVFYWMQ